MTKEIIKRQLKGKVVSELMDKTVVVVVERIKKHTKYFKQYKTSKRYKAHDPKNEYKKGDKVVIEAMRPISKDKRWKVVGKQ